MKNNKSILKFLMSFITYNKKNKVKEFYIPEVNEEDQTSNYKENSSQSNNFNGSNNQNINQAIYYMGTEKDSFEANTQGNNTTANINSDIDSNIDFLNKSFHYPNNTDIIIRQFKIGEKYRAFIVYLQGMVDNTIVSNFILRPLLNNNEFLNEHANNEIDSILSNVIETNEIRKIVKPEDVINEILIGDTGIYIEGCNYYVFCDTKGFEKRSVDKPQIEGSVKGPHEAFNENLTTNITLIRKIIKNKDLVAERLKVGDTNNNNCAVMYINGIVNPAIVQEVKRRINGIKTDFVLGGGMLEQYIEDNTWSIIPTILSTERPDRTAAHILEGRVAVIVDGTPSALVVPVTFFLLLHTSEDSVLKWQYGILLRFTRIFAIFMSILLPALYIALTNYHQEMIPTALLIAIGESRENVPFTTVVEVLFMELSFDLIREAGIRVPGIIGNTIGIVGALIIGQAAVQANIISPVLIIVIAFTTLGTYSIPDFSLAYGVRMTRLLFIIFAGVLGFLGISIGLVIFITILINLKSFGVPFLSSIAPKTRQGTDAVFRLPIWKQELRPDAINPLDNRRQPEISRPWVEEDAAVPVKDNSGTKEE